MRVSNKKSTPVSKGGFCVVQGGVELLSEGQLLLTGRSRSGGPFLLVEDCLGSRGET